MQEIKEIFKVVSNLNTMLKQISKFYRSKEEDVSTTKQEQAVRNIYVALSNVEKLIDALKVHFGLPQEKVRRDYSSKYGGVNPPIEEVIVDFAQNKEEYILLRFCEEVAELSQAIVNIYINGYSHDRVEHLQEEISDVEFFIDVVRLKYNLKD